MDAKILTGILLCFCFMASISLSQSASASLDSRLRFRRQDESDAGSTANVEGNTEAATAILADGTTIVLPPGTTATINADAVDAALTTGAGGTAETVTNGATGATTADGDLEASTIVDDVLTSVKPGNGHAEEASNDTTADTDVTTSAAAEAVTLDSDSTAVTGNDTSAEPGLTTIGAGEADGNGTRPDGSEVTPAPGGQPGGQAELRVVVSPEVLQVQYGRTVELTCTVYGGDANTNIYWIQDEPERRYAPLDPPSANDKQVTASQVILRSKITLDDRSKIGKYTCMAQDAAGNSGSAVLTMQEGGGGGYPVPPYPGAGPQPSGRYLRIVAPDMTEGDYVEIQCEGAAPEDEGRIQWYFNNRVINDESPLYPRGKTLHIRPISRPYLGNYRCTVPGAGYTDANSVLTFGGASQGIVPSGPIGPSGPSSSVGRCGIDEATCRNGRCIPRAYLCDGKDDCGDSSDETCGPHGVGADVCQPNEIRCSDHSRGRKCVQKFWMCDGDRDCDDGSDEEYRYCELLPRQRNCKPSEFECTGRNNSANPICIPRSFQCDGYNDCPDRSDEVGCVKPTVTSPPQRQVQVNAGQTLTLQCTARGSPAPYINWRLNWGHICGDGSDNGRCTIAQALDARDASIVTGTLTVRNVNGNDAGAYSCEALNNQGFIFAIPDAIVNVIVEPGVRPAQPCSCNGHSSQCATDGRCLNCQHNTAGYNCEHCAAGYQGDARRGTPYDCTPTVQYPPPTSTQCNAAGTQMERGGRCICKYNVEGDRCDQCKRSHFYLNPTTPNGCLPCFCSGVSTDCSSTDWRRHATALPLNNWNAVPKNFATDRYEARDRIQQRQGGREIALDQSSLGRPNNEVLYWKAPKEVLGHFVTLYDGNIDVHFTNDGNDKEAPSNDDFIWLRGNNIDLVHKIPQTQRFKSNTNATYSVPVNERTFTRKDGTHIDRENILMALSDLDTLLIKINPIGGRRTAVLRGVTLNPAAQQGFADAAPTVEACRCPANYTGSSCEKCAEGYGRPHPLVGIYLGQCWACRSLCHEKSDQCDKETGKCSNCQGNSEGDRCERCRAGYVLDGRSNQCVSQDGYVPPAADTGSRGAYYVDQKPYNPSSAAPLNIILDGRPEQRIPLQVLNVQPQSIVWGRTDGSPLPAGVVQEGNDLVFRNPSAEQAGNYICTITHSDGFVERINVYVDYRPGAGYGRQTAFNPPSPLVLDEGASQYIQPPSGYIRYQWSRADGQPFPSGVYQNGNLLQITRARPDHAGTYYCYVYGADGSQNSLPYEVQVLPGHHAVGHAPRVTIQPKIINLKEGQRMIVQYAVASHDPIEVIWNKKTDQGYQPIPSLFTVEPNRLVLNRATPDAAGEYQVIVRNIHGEERQDLRINVEPRRGRGRGGQGAGAAPQIIFQREQYEIGNGETVAVVPNISGSQGGSITWTKDGSANLPYGVTASGDGALQIYGTSPDIAGQYNLDVTNANGARTSKVVYVRWREGGGSNQQGYQGGNAEPSGDAEPAEAETEYIDVRFRPRTKERQHVGSDIELECRVQGPVVKPIEYKYTKDGQPLGSHVEVHPDGILIIRQAQAEDHGNYRCEVNFPRAPETGKLDGSFYLKIDAAGGGDHSHHGGDHSHHGGSERSQHVGGDHGQHGGGGEHSGQIEVTVEPAEVNIAPGEKATVTCNVKGASGYKVTWGKYAHDTSLPSYARQQGNSVIISPPADTPDEQMYLQCQVDVPGQPQAIHAYAPVNIRGGESSKKKKKRRS